jgi:ketosteroid isomerase-like protein
MVSRPTLTGVLVLAFSGAVTFCGCPRESPVDTLVISERAFAALSLAQNTRTAFLTFLDDSAVIFRPHPVNGKEWISRQPTRPSVLSWKPAFAECSAGGDLGFTSGPWKFSTSAQAKEPVAFGYFVSVWGRKLHTGWKVLLDMGTSNPRPASDTTLLHLGPLSQSGERGRRPRGSASFMDVERGFGRAAGASGLVEAYRVFASDGCRFYREGHLPAVGFREARAILGETERAPEFTPLAMHQSAAGDLAYVYGHYEVPGTVPAESGYYLHIWEISPTGSAALVLDLLSPLPGQ